MRTSEKSSKLRFTPHQVKIANKQPFENERALISLDEKLDPIYNTVEEKKKRADAAGEFKKIFEL